jgi:hypothetical protein
VVEEEMPLQELVQQMVEVVIQEVEVHLQIHLVLDQQVMELSTLVVVVEEQLQR